MAKIRVHELAKELNKDTAEIIAVLGGDYKAVSGVEEADANRVRDHFTEKKPEVKVAQKATAPVEKTEEKAPEKAEAPKKKKPVLLFRPENSKTSFGDKLKKNTKGTDAPAKKDEKKPEVKTAQKAGFIKPDVKTTAEQYKELQGEESEKIKKVTETTISQEIKEAERKAEEAAKKAAEEAAKKAAEDALKAEAAKKAAEEAAKKAAEDAAKAEAAKKAAEDAAKAEAAKKVAEEAAKAEEAKKAAEDAAKKAEEEALKAEAAKKAEAEKRAADKKPVQGEKKPEQHTAPKTDVKSPVKPVAILGKIDLNELKRQEESAKNPAKKGIFANKKGGNVHFVDNRNKQGDNNGKRPFDRNGNNQGRPFDRNNQGRPNQGGQGQGGFRQGNRPDNRGIFAKDGDKDGRQQGNSFVRVNRDNQGGPALSKTDVRGKKNNTKTDKDRNNFDHSGKNAENFKNLSKGQNKKPAKQQEAEEQIKLITIPDVITIKDLSDKMKLKSSELIKKLFLQGKMMTVNSELSYEEAEEIALEYEILCEKEVQVDVIEELLREEDEDEKLLVERPPVVCVMGHVDHGKTSLLDAIRSTNVTAREAGGITQHIGAYMVECKGKKITFLDTPGHEAFTAMRMRGAQATDIAVLVVAADDGVKPQTIEAINHAKAAGVEVIVAVNKIDKPTANVERVKQELSEYELVAEDWGGSTVFCPVSAKTGENIDNLLEMILLVTEVKELKANPNREMRGLVIEAKLDKGRGPVATVLVQKGTMKQGDFVSAGSFYGRVRAMLDADGNAMKTATPSTPVEILGLNGVPNAGEVCIGHKNEKDARAYAETFIAEEKKKMLAETKQKLTMDSLFSQIQAGNIKELPIVVKADVQGSVEAVRTSLEKLSNEEVSVKVIHGGVGAINESDVSLASASNAIVIGFNVKPDQQAKTLAEQENVDLKLYRVIYQAIDDVEAAMKGMLAPVYEEQVLGHAEIRQTFKASGVGIIAGSYVLDGTFERGCMARIKRDGEEIFDGKIASLKRFKDDVKEVKEGFECGIVFEKFNDIQEGDTVEAYKMVQVARE